jgi:hypothetical protein
LASAAGRLSRGSVSSVAADLIRQGLLQRACEAVAADEAAHDDPEWESYRLSQGLS